MGPIIVAVHESKSPSALGKADIPGDGESISCISSDCRLLFSIDVSCCCLVLGVVLGVLFGKTYRLVTL